MGSKSSETERKEMEIASNEKIADQNLNFQKENLDYQKALQQQIFQREDSNIQRQVTDARLAGISPLTVGLQGGQAGAEVATTAPQNTMHYDYSSGMSTDAQKMQMLTSAISSVSDVIKQTQALQYGRQQIQQLKLENEFASRTLNSRTHQNFAESTLKQIEVADSRNKEYYNRVYGIHSGMSDKEKLARIIITNLFGQETNNVSTYDEYGYYSPSKKRYEYSQGDYKDLPAYGAHNIKDTLMKYFKQIIPDFKPSDKKGQPSFLDYFDQLMGY